MTYIVGGIILRLIIEQKICTFHFSCLNLKKKIKSSH